METNENFIEGEDFEITSDGKVVMTAKYLSKRGDAVHPVAQIARMITLQRKISIQLFLKSFKTIGPQITAPMIVMTARMTDNLKWTLSSAANQLFFLHPFQFFNSRLFFLSARSTIKLTYFPALYWWV